MKLDTEEEWQKMASTACGFASGLVFCRWFGPPSWLVFSAMIVAWIGSACRSVYCKMRDARNPGADE